MEAKVARHSEWIEGHEKRCEERFGQMKETVRELKEAMGSWRKAMWAIAVAIAGWALVQLYNNIQAHPAPAVAVAVAPPRP